MTRMKRLLSLVLCAALLMFSLPAIAESASDTQAYDLSLSFRMDASTFPEDEQDVLVGVADLLNILEVKSSLTWWGDLLALYTGYDSDVSFGLSGKEDLLQMRIWGTPDHIALDSAAFGGQTLMLNMLAWLEFAMKAYFHLEMPLQNAALITSTFAHYSAFLGVTNVFQQATAGEGSRVLSREDCLALAHSLSETAQSDRAFTMWVNAALLDAGYSDMVMESIAMLPDWADSFLAEDGVTITVSDDTETWQTGETVLFTRTGESWSLQLPATLDGYTAAAAFTKDGTNADFTLTFSMEEEGDILALSAAASDLPAAEASSGKPQVKVDLTGAMLPEKHLHFALDWTRDDSAAYPVYAFTAAMLTPESGDEMLAVTGTATGKQPTVDPHYTAEQIDECSVNVFSVYEDTLSELVHTAEKPFLETVLPILVELPASSYASIFALLDRYSVLTLLTEGIE